MCKFKLLKKQTVLALFAAFLMSACGIGRVGEETQRFFSRLPILNKTGKSLRQGACKAGEAKDIQKINESISLKAGRAPFLVTEVKGNVGTDYKGNLPNEFRLNLKACIKDSLKEDTSIPIASFTLKYQTIDEKGKIVSKTISRSTDDEGCLIWTEVYPYRYVVQPFWLRLHREIIKEDGAYAGEVTLPTAVNFWLEGEDAIFPSVMDLRRRYYQNDDIFKKHLIADQGLQCLKDKAGQPLLQIWAPDVNIQFSQSPSSDKIKKYKTPRSLINGHYKKSCTDDNNSEDCSARNLNMELTIPLELRTRRLNGALRVMRVNGGHYNITARLVAEYPEGREKYYQIHNETLSREKVSMSFREGQGTQYLNPKFQLKIPYFNTTANHKLVLEIQEKNGLPFRKFQGVYTLKKLDMGSVKTFTRDSFLEKTYSLISDEDTDDSVTVIEDMNIEYIYTYAKKEAQKMKKEFPNTAENILIQRALRKRNFKQAHMSVSIETVRFANTKNNEDCESNETIVKRRVEYVGRACLDDIFTEIKDTDFKIFREDLTSNTGLVELFRVEEKDGYKEPLSTNQANCIAWRDTIDHKNFDRQIYFPRRMYFYSEEQQDLYGEALIAVSPWHNQFQFFQDITQLHLKGIRTKPKGAEHPRLVIPQFKSVNFFPSSIIDSFLNLRIKYNVRYLFQPIITRPDSLAWGKLPRSRELIRDGYYLARVLIARSPYETGHLSRVETQKESDKKRAAVLNDDLELDFNNLKYINHTDTVIRVDANFVNMAVPIEFNTQQLLYLGSRNVVILQIAPANPEKYVFKPIKQDGSCHLDTKQTKWEPYIDHDLITFPFVGPFNVQNWTNWNVLQKACKKTEGAQGDTLINCLQTDKIIDQSEEGSRFRYFDMDPVVNASIEKDGGQVQKAHPPQSVVIKSKDADKKDPSIIKGIAGSDSCINRSDNLRQAELQRQSVSMGQRRVTNSDSTTIEFKERKPIDELILLGQEREAHPEGVTFEFGERKPNDKIIKACKEDPSCNFIQSEIANSMVFGPMTDGRTLEDFWLPEKERPSNGVQMAGLGTAGCIEEEVVVVDPESQKNEEFIPAASLDSDPKDTINTLLKDFARINSLRVLDLSHAETKDKFIKDINSQSNWIDEIAKQIKIRRENGIVFNTVSFLLELFEGMYGPDKNREEFLSLWSQIDKKCNTDYLDYFTDLSLNPQQSAESLTESHDGSLRNSVIGHQQKEKTWEEFYHKCAISFFRDHLNDKIVAFEKSETTAESDQEFQEQYGRFKEARETIEKLNAPLSSPSDSQDLLRKVTRLNAWDEDTMKPLFLERIVSEGIEKVIGEDTVLVNSFTHSLCGFWFRSFLKDYLQVEQMQYAFNDYVRKLDYKLILESDLYSTEAGLREDLLEELFEMTPKEKGYEQCSESYRKCALQDYCSAFDHSDSRTNVNGNPYCRFYAPLIGKDESCQDFTFRKCQEQKSKESRLCQQTVGGSFESERQCKVTVKTYCETNTKDIICAEYNDMKCLSNYMSCSDKAGNTFMQAKEDIINYWKNIKMQEKGNPVKACLNNPYEFFHFESKMFVGDISDVRYLRGLMQHFSINGSFSIGSYLNWGSERKTAMGMKLGVRGGAMAFLVQERMTFWKKLVSLLSFDSDVNIGISTGESNAVRRSVDTRLANSSFLVASEAGFEVDVTHFKRCLVIKPRPNAFTAEYGEEGLPEPYDEEDVWPQSFHGKDFKKIALARPGLMICNPLRVKEENPETIKEDYYYISQSNVRTETAHLLNLYDIANRPFVIVLRGRKEFMKYSHLLRQVTEGKNTDTEEIASSNEAPVNMFIHYPFPVENLAGFSLAMRAFRDTGFYPGVYTYPSSMDNILNAPFVDRKEGSANTMLKWLHDHINIFDVPAAPSSSVSHKPVSE